MYICVYMQISFSSCIMSQNPGNPEEAHMFDKGNNVDMVPC